MHRQIFTLPFFVLLFTALAAAERDSAPKLLSTKGGAGAPAWSTIEELQKAAQAGNARARFELADKLLVGAELPRDFPRALALLEQAAEGGEPNAAFRLGKLYEDGELVPSDPAKALAYYLRSAFAGIKEAQYNLGAMYSSGRGVKRDYAEGLAWLIIATKNGAPPEGEQQLRDFLTKGRRPQAIAAGEARAAEIGKQITSGQIPAAPPTAPAADDKTKPPAVPAPAKPPQKIKIDPSATKPAAPAFTPPPPSAIKLPEKSAKHAPADSGPPVKIITPTAGVAEWPSLGALEAAANEGQPAALATLGQVLLAGKLTPADPERAFILLERGAKAGSADAAYHLAEIYTNGVLAPRDDAKAFRYYEQAARGGAPLAIFNLGALHANGRGTTRDYTEALAWFIIAKHRISDKGMEQRIREHLRKNAPEQIALAEKRAAELEKEIAVTPAGTSVR